MVAQAKQQASNTSSTTMNANQSTWKYFQPCLVVLLIATQCSGSGSGSGKLVRVAGSSSSINQEMGRQLADASVTVTIDNPLLGTLGPTVTAQPSPAPTPAPTPFPTSTSTKPLKVPLTPPPTDEATDEATIQLPPPASTGVPAAAGPTDSPSAAVVVQETDAPLDETTTNAPIPSPTANATVAATPAEIETSESETSAPSTMNSATATTASEPNATTPEETETSATADLVSQVQAIRNEAVFSTKFSLWSSQSDTTNLQTRVLRSLEVMFCQASSDVESVLEEQGRVCVLRDTGGDSSSSSSSVNSNDNNMLEDGSVVELGLEAPTEEQLVLGDQDPDATILRLSMEPPVKKDGTFEAGSLSWSEWEVSWVVVRLGASRTEQVVLEQQRQQQTGGSSSVVTLNIMDVYEDVVETLEEEFVEDFDTSILDGSFDHLVNTVTYEGSLAVSAKVGDEETSFGPFAAPTTTTAPGSGEEPSSNKDDDSKMYVVLFFAGLGVGFVAILVFLFFACKPRIEEYVYSSAHTSQKKSSEDVLDVTDEQTSQEDSRDARDSPTEAHHKIIVIDSIESVTSNGEVEAEYEEDTGSRYDDAASSGTNSLAGTNSVAQSVAYSGVWSVASME